MLRILVVEDESMVADSLPYSIVARTKHLSPVTASA